MSMHPLRRLSFAASRLLIGLSAAGLIAMTAGASLISPMWALFFGFFTTLYCYIVSELIVARYFPALGWNSTFSLHFLGAATSSALTGLFASGTFNNNIGNFIDKKFATDANYEHSSGQSHNNPKKLIIYITH
jgi:ammonia channel protein AmtB